MRKMVTILALAQTSLNVRMADGTVQPVTLNPNESGEKAAAKEAKKAGREFRSAYEQQVPEEVAMVLVEKGVAKIKGMTDKEAKKAADAASKPKATKPVVEAAGERLNEHTPDEDDDADAKPETGASTRDTTAFAKPPLKRAPANVTELAEGEEQEDDADAAPTGDDDGSDDSNTVDATKMTNAEVEAHVATIENADELALLRAAEEKAENRKGALKAIDDRIAALSQ